MLSFVVFPVTTKLLPKSTYIYQIMYGTVTNDRVIIKKMVPFLPVGWVSYNDNDSGLRCHVVDLVCSNVCWLHLFGVYWVPCPVAVLPNSARTPISYIYTNAICPGFYYSEYGIKMHM